MFESGFRRREEEAAKGPVREVRLSSKKVEEEEKA